jgi:outer membrane protein assembly factor BamB
MKKNTAASLALFLFFFAITILASGADWPRWRGPEGNGISKETEWNPESLRSGPKFVWKTGVGFGYSNVSIKNNRLYTMGRKDGKTAVFCINADTGKEIWRSDTDSIQDPQSTPTIDGGSVYALSKEGLLLCLMAKSGKIVWKRNIVKEYQARAPYYGFAVSPVVDGDSIILNANSAGMALNGNTGELKWGSEKPPKDHYHVTATSNGVEYATPVVYEQGEKKHAVVSSYKGLHAVDTQTGKVLWVYDWEEVYNKIGCQITDPIIFDKKLFTVQYYPNYLGGFLLDISGREPKVLWMNKDLHSQTGSPVMIDGYFYICSAGIETGVGSLQCIDGTTGKIMWEKSFDNKPISITAANGKLIILGVKGNVFIADASPSAYREISRCVIPGQKGYERWWTSPVLCGGRLYCRSYTGELVCIDVRK